MPDAKARIVYNFDAWDGATITSSSEASTDLADDNVVHDFVSLPWRTTGDTSEWVKFDLGSATAITCVGIFAHNLTSAATVTLQANASDSWGSPSYSQVLPVATDADGVVVPHIVYYLSQNYRWWRVTFADAANTDTYIQVGVIRGGAYYEVSRNYNSALPVQYIDPSEGAVTPGRQDHKRQRSRYRRATLGFTLQDRTQADKLRAIVTKIGTSKPCILGLDATNYPTAESMYCYMRTPLSLAHRFNQLWDTGSLVFEEVTE